MRQPFLRQELERQGIPVACLKDARHGHVRDPGIRLGDPRPDQPLGRLGRQRLELQRLEPLHRAVRHQRARACGRPQLVGPRRQNQQESRTPELARHDVEDRDRCIIGRMDIVHDEHQGALLGRRLEGFEERVRQSERNDLRRPLHRLGDTGERGEDLGRHACQLAQSLRIRSPDRPL